MNLSRKILKIVITVAAIVNIALVFLTNDYTGFFSSLFNRTDTEEMAEETGESEAASHADSTPEVTPRPVSLIVHIVE